MTENNYQIEELSLLFPRKRDKGSLRRGMKRSAIAHTALAIFILLSALVWHHEPVVYKPTLRVDLVGLPDLKVGEKRKDLNLDEIAKELEKPKTKTEEPPKAEPKKEKAAAPDVTESDMALKKKEKGTKKDLKSAIDRIKALESIEDQVKKTSKKAAAPPIRGNVISKGSSDTGEAGESNLGEFVDAVQAKLRSNWDLPVWLSKQNLSARIVIFLDSSGYLKSAIVAKSSGNDQYDNFALKTVRKSQPFPKPPAQILDDGLVLLFPL